MTLMHLSKAEYIGGGIPVQLGTFWNNKTTANMMDGTWKLLPTNDARSLSRSTGGRSCARSTQLNIELGMDMMDIYNFRPFRRTHLTPIISTRQTGSHTRRKRRECSAILRAPLYRLRRRLHIRNNWMIKSLRECCQALRIPNSANVIPGIKGRLEMIMKIDSLGQRFLT